MTEPEQGSSNRQLNQAQQQAVYRDEIDLRELVGIIWSGKWIVGGVAAAVAIAAVVYALSIPNVYRAEALLAPAGGGGSSGLDVLASQYGGLASLAGININGLSGEANSTLLGIEVLQSRKFIGEFVERQNILAPLMAVDDWDGATNEVAYDESIYDIESNEWVRIVKAPKKPEPSQLEAYKRFREILSVTQDSDTGFVRVSVEYYSPQVAKNWIDALIESIKTEIKRQEVEEAKRSIAYLREQLDATSLAELQSIFYELIEEQTKKIMLAEVRSEYLFKTIDPASIPETPSSPNRKLIVIIGTLLGGVLGLAWVILRYGYSEAVVKSIT